MKLSRRSRFVATLLALISVLFTQLAVAGYVCPSMEIGQAIGSIAASAVPIDHHAVGGCEGGESAKTELCQHQSQVSKQSLDKPELPHVSPFMATMLVQAVSHADSGFRSIDRPAEANFLTRTTAPPLSIRNCCFRI
ncbi:MAG: hypothetical protein Q8Q81_02985 [Oxalobacteraceae bacterium]|nr:hypothetical protein [Oxalobacteraceae bacterium]